MLSKDKLVYVSATPADGDSVAAFLHATLKLTSTTVGGSEALDVNLVSPITVDTDVKGIYDVSTNPTPDSVGLIAHTRGATDDTTQVERLTSASPSADGIVSADVDGIDSNSFLMGYNGTTWDRLLATSGKLQTISSVVGDVADDAADSGNPIKVGTRALSGALAAVSTTGDRADMISDLYRRLRVNNTPNVAGSNAAVAVDTTVGGVAVFASPLAGRVKAEVQNLGSKAIYIGFGTVSAVNGTRIAAGATYTTDIGPDLALKAIAESGSQDVRVLQLA